MAKTVKLKAYCEYRFQQAYMARNVKAMSFWSQMGVCAQMGLRYRFN